MNSSKLYKRVLGLCRSSPMEALFLLKTTTVKAWLMNINTAPDWTLTRWRHRVLINIQAARLRHSRMCNFSPLLAQVDQSVFLKSLSQSNLSLKALKEPSSLPKSIQDQRRSRDFHWETSIPVWSPLTGELKWWRVARRIRGFLFDRHHLLLD